MEEIKKSIDHMPEHKQAELQKLLEVILNRKSIPEFIILFGSHAIRGDGNCFDILLAMEQGNQVGSKNWKAMQRVVNKCGIVTPVRIVGKGIRGLNQKIRGGNYFLNDVIQEGIILYDSGQFELSEPNIKEHRQKEASEFFNYWFRGAQDFFAAFEWALYSEKYNFAAFQLHQVAERLYAAVLIVFHHYREKEHDIELMAEKAADCDPSLLTVFSKSIPDEVRLFKLLKSAYIGARYKQTFTITKQDLLWLAERLHTLENLTEEVCRRKIESYC